MREILLFAEDAGHEVILTALVVRMAEESGVAAALRPYSVRGGHGKVLAELRELKRELEAGDRSMPDLLLIASDANCQGFSTRRREIEAIAPGLQVPIVYAIPDPHVERWLLLDSTAFKAALGRGCAAPDQKCARDRYKVLLRNAVRETGRMPLLGGLEHTESIVRAMDLQALENGPDRSLARFLKELRARLTLWTEQ